MRLTAAKKPSVVVTLPLLVILGVVMSACANASGYTWKEEVLLHDGRKMIVERSLERGGRREVGQTSPIRSQSLSLMVPGTTKKVVWLDQFDADIGSANFLAKLVDVHKGSAYLVASPMGCLSYNKWERPNPPYVIFKYQNDGWQRVSLNDLPKEIKTPNLIPTSPDEEAKATGQAVVSSETIRRMYDGYTQPELKTIVREAIPNPGGEGCEEMVSTGKGGWLGIDWFKNQPNLGACLTVCAQKKMSDAFCPCKKIFKGN